MKKIIIVLLLSIVNCQFSICQIGTWRNYLAYSDVQQIQEAGNEIFVLASGGLYLYNKQDKSIHTFDKTNGLNDINITHIKWCQQAKRLVIVYNSSNIDLMDLSCNVINISDIYSKAITGDKSINSIYIYNQYAYLACGFGIVKLDVKRTEISESYMLGFAVKNITIENNNIYAKDAKGSIWTASLNNNLIDTSYWQQTSTAPSFAEDTTDYDKYYETISTLNPGGPKYNYFGYMKFHNGKLYTCNGDFNHSSGIQVLQNNEWTIYQNEGISDITGVSYQGAYCFDIDPTDDNHIFTGSRNGLYEFKNGKFVNFYNSNNSPIESYNDKSLNYQLITAVKYDNTGNLWFLNSQAATQSIIRYSGGQFKSFEQPVLMKLSYNNFMNRSLTEMSNIIIDHEQLMWFVNNSWRLPSLYQYNPEKNTIIAYEHFVNQDGITIEIGGGVRCVVEDLDHNIWVGTSSGPLLLERSQMNENNPVFTQVKVPRNDGTNFADYLLAGIDISAIAIDAGGRKWFGTKNNGAFLISADNMEQIHHFTVDNSNILSNSILSIAVNQSSGEVFFGTEKGLCSFMSDATETNEEMTSDNVYAYPNPVTKEYTGLITIVGLSYNSDVKILSPNGALIAEGRSNGGSFTWDGCDKKGSRVASGVYMVATATKEGKKGTVCKIAIIR